VGLGEQLGFGHATSDHSVVGYGGAFGTLGTLNDEFKDVKEKCCGYWTITMLPIVLLLERACG
jgi:hypothetical protein